MIRKFVLNTEPESRTKVAQLYAAFNAIVGWPSC
jgi:hypothetical protein